jgi:hypothetical protein
LTASEFANLLLEFGYALIPIGLPGVVLVMRAAALHATHHEEHHEGHNWPLV